MSDESNSIKPGYEDPWPPVRGDYLVGTATCGVAVVTLASPIYPKGAAICGQCKTENLGVEKIVANVISNCNIRILILCGVESKGHLPGNTILALHRNGIDEQGRIIGSMGAIPFIQNLPAGAIERFQQQVQLVNCIGLEDIQQIEELIRRYDRYCQPYPSKPFQVIKRIVASRRISFGQGDISLGSRVVMDASAWIVTEEIAAKADAEG
ncbi:MAG: Tetrahydromethanopterin S-methyltransferase subunit A 1 [Methanosaeta sp. PtaU1.Bin112]|nr:MAG: Tetrahydromethanopterin S-methyltransferase subunit A 1 [Methanosaeta sp. PtaU1.Bin112]